MYPLTTQKMFVFFDELRRAKFVNDRRRFGLSPVWLHTTLQDELFHNIPSMMIDGHTERQTDRLSV